MIDEKESEAENNEDSMATSKSVSISDITERKRAFNLEQIKTYILLKALFWNCVLDSEDIKREEQEIDLNILLGLMQEILSYVNYYFLNLRAKGFKAEAKRLEEIQQIASKRGSRYNDEADSHDIV